MNANTPNTTAKESVTVFSVADDGGKSALATLTVRVHNAAAARRTAWRAVGFLGLVAVAALPIPIVHFIVPPAMLLLAPLVWMVIFRLFRSGIDVSGDAACPACGEAVRLSLALDSSEDAADATASPGQAATNCPACQARLMLLPHRPLPR